MAYIEVPHTFDTQPSKTYNLPNDSSARTLQDLKFPERGGGFGFASSNQLTSKVRNRFLYWRWCNGGLEVLEDSLDTNLRSNWIKIIFSNTCVLYAEAFERDTEIHLLVCTASSAVRLIFQHPGDKQDGHVGRSAGSIFHDMEGLCRQVVPVRALQQPGQLRCATALVRPDGSAAFAFCLTTGAALLVTMPPYVPGDDEEPAGATTFELRYSSTMRKLWSGIVPTFASRSDGVSLDSATDAIFIDQWPTLLVTVCRDHKLRVWSLESRDLVKVIDLIECLMFKVDPKSLQLKSQGHSLRLAPGGPGRESSQLGVHLNCVQLSYVLIFKVDPTAHDVHSCLLPLTSLSCDEREELADWCLVPARREAWLLHQSEQGYWLSCRSSREPGRPPLPALFASDVMWPEEEEEEEDEEEMEMEEEGEVPEGWLPAEKDPQENCLRAIFTPGRFSALALSRALTSLRQEAGETAPLGKLGLAGLAPGTPAALREEIIQLMAEKIAQTISEQAVAQEMDGGSEEIPEGDLRQIRRLHWSDFLASVLEYQRSLVARPVGLLVNPHTGMVGLIRKAGLSLFRRAELVEVCAYLPPVINSKTVPGLTPSACSLLENVRLLQQRLGPRALLQFHEQLESRQKNPEEIAAALVKKLSFEEEQDLLTRLSAQEDLLEAMKMLIEIAESLPDVDDMSDDSDAEERVFMAYTHPERFLFGSPLAENCLARSVDGIVFARLRLAAGLLLIQKLLANPQARFVSIDWLGSKPGFTGQALCRQLVSLIESLTYMRWLATARLTTPSALVMNRLFSQLGLLGCGPCNKTFSVEPVGECQRSLLELFLHTAAGDGVRSHLRAAGLLDAGPNEHAKALWADVFPFACSCLQAKLCPSSGEAVLAFCRFLFQRGQAAALLKLARLLQGWWKRDAVLVSFVQGLALLLGGDAQRALLFFTTALDELRHAWERPSASVLPGAVLGPKVDLLRPIHLHQVNIALKIMRALEVLEEPRLVVELAQHALKWLMPEFASRPQEEVRGDEGEPSVEEEERQLKGVLWTAIFKHELAVGRNRQAFHALQWNVDDSSRKDCLRQLIVTLCERKQCEELVSFEYGKLEEDFLNILQSRARAADLQEVNYYNLLFSYYVTLGAYRRAAAALYELAVRLGREVHNLRSLQGQGSAFVSALTALRIVKKEDQWLERPCLSPGQSPEAIPLETIRREWRLVNARLRVAEIDLEMAMITAGPLSVSDTVRGLLKVGLYNLALELCELFAEPLEPVFDCLTSRCMALPLLAAGACSPQQQRDLQLEKDRLIEGLMDADCAFASEGVPIEKLAWSLLQAYVKAHAKGNYWKTVISKLLANRQAIPAWLVTEGKVRHPAALLRLYLQNDEIELASYLALELIENASSRISVASSEQTCLPHLWLRHLRAALGYFANSHQQCARWKMDIEAKLANYYELLEQTGREKERMMQQRRQAFV